MFNKYSVRARLIFLLIMTSTALVCMGALGLIGIKLMNKEVDSVFLGGIGEIQKIFKIRENLTWSVANDIEGAKNGSIKASAAFEHIEASRQKALEEWINYKKTDLDLSNESQAEWDKVVELINQLIKNSETFFNRAKEVLLQNNMEQIDVLRNYQTDYVPLSRALAELIHVHLKEAEMDYNHAKENAHFYSTMMFVGLIVSLTLSFLVAYSIIRSIVKPLQYVVKNVDLLAEGDTSMEIQTNEGGEIGLLLNSLRNMIFNSNRMSVVLSDFASGDLTQKVSPRSENDTLGISLNKMSTEMRAMIGNIKEEVNVLSSSSEEILSSLAQLTSGTAESAAAVTETTTTLEELKQTAQVSSEKAKDVLANAEETLATVKASEKSVQSVIEDMDQIRDRMQIISESIVKLSEKSLAIAEIMDSVNDIAEQSNLLAVNAAIEAAKAGEQGRSFSVVAQEIRTLAEQSKGATIQVRSLLNDIQNATNVAVLATEQGSKAVAKGVDQSNQTTEAIKELAGNMTRVTQSANQIVLSNQQQSIGTEQISIAMSNINESTQQHVDRLKEIEGAISALNQVSTSLKGLTDQYKLIPDDDSKYERSLPHMIDKIQKSSYEKKYQEQH
jgi:methyl-accepting chemotaxis protein